MKLTAKPGISLAQASGGYYEVLPDNYDPTKKYSLFIFFHGQGEKGNGTSDLPSILNNAPMTYVKSGALNIQAIILAPQIKDAPAYAYVITQIIEKAATLYGIDRTRVYATGLSLGAVPLWDLARGMAIKQVAAIIPVAGAWDKGSSPIATASIYRDEKLPVWALHNQGDPTVPVDYTNTWIAAINSPLAKKTIFPGGGHDAWTKAYDPAFKENGMNVYEWAMQYTTARGAIEPPVVVPPVVVPPTTIAWPELSPIPTNTHGVSAVGPGEYLCGFIRNGKVYGIFAPNGKPEFIEVPGISEAVGVEGGQYSFLVWAKNGLAYEVNKAAGLAKAISYSIPGGTVYGRMFNQMAMLVNPAGDLYYVLNKIVDKEEAMEWPLTTSPTLKLSGFGIIKISHLTNGLGLIFLTNKGEVFTWARGKQPVKIMDNATDITSVTRGAFVAATATDIFAWGPQSIYLGVNSMTPVSLKSKLPGIKFPLRQIVGNGNVLQMIDADNWRYAGGDNAQGEIGNGKGITDWAKQIDPFAWPWKNGMLIEPFQKLDQYVRVYSSGSMAFYFFGIKLDGKLTSWGRNKSFALANGEYIEDTIAIPGDRTQQTPNAKYPNALSVYTPWEIADLTKVVWTKIPFDPATALNDRKQVPDVVVPPVVVPPVGPTLVKTITIKIYSDGSSKVE